jgi:putative nucleotidyltransferase with HDIG domain
VDKLWYSFFVSTTLSPKKPQRNWDNLQLPLDPQAEVRGLVAIGIATLRGSARDLAFDVFLKVSSDNFVHVFSSSTGLDYLRLSQYESRGVLALYVRKTDLETYKKHIARSAEQLLADLNLPDENRVALVMNMTEQALVDVFTQVRIAEGTAVEVKKVVRKYVDLMLASPRSMAMLLKLISHGDYLYYHSIAVCVFSLLLGRTSGQFHTEDLEHLGLGAFLHDVGHLSTPKEILEAPRKLTPEELAIVREHTDQGLDQLKENPEIPKEVLQIVYQHHEQPDGKGYPNQLSDKAMSHFAKVVQIADCFSALISRRPWRPAFTVQQAVKTLLEEGDRHDRKLVALLSQLSVSQVPASRPPSSS